MRKLEGRSTPIFVVTVIFLGISFIAVALRCFVRLRLVKAFGWDDAFMVFAMALNILFAICGITGALYGLGWKFEQFKSKEDIQTALFWWWLGQTSYVFTCAMAKVSIALALLRLTVKKVHSIIMWAVIAVTCIVGIVFWFMLTLQCQPVSEFWMRTGEGTCMETDHIIDIAYAYSVTACICDFTLGLFPVFLVKDLQMNRRTKLALAGILSMGCVASAAVVIRIPYLKDYKDPDFLYATADISIWSNIEAGLGITAGSLITLRPLFRWFKDGSYGGSRSARKTAGSVPLSSMNGTQSLQFKNDANSPHYWRPDVDLEDSHALVTTVHTSPGHGRRSSSQEALNPKESDIYQGGVNVQRTFFVSAGDA